MRVVVDTNVFIRGHSVGCYLNNAKGQPFVNIGATPLPASNADWEAASWFPVTSADMSIRNPQHAEAVTSAE